MGNVSSYPTRKLELLNEEYRDYSYNAAVSVFQQATQNIIVNQRQTVNMKDIKLNNCNIIISQTADIDAQLTAEFQNIFSSPKQMINLFSKMFDNIIKANSGMSKDFLDTAKNVFGVSNNASIKRKITDIMKINITSNICQMCSQNIFVSQIQNVSLQGIECKDGNIQITQQLILNAAATCIFEVSQSLLLSDPKFRQAVREFNGDYNRGLQDELVESSPRMPDICFLDKTKDNLPQPPCSCPPCPNYPDVNSVLFNGWFLYGTLASCYVILLLLFLLK